MEMAGGASRYPWSGTAGLWNSSWPPGSRNQNADSDTDSEHRRLREDREREEDTTSEDDTRSHISVDGPEAEPSDEDTESHITVEDLREVHEMESDTETDTASNDLATVDLTSSDPFDPVDTSSYTIDPDETTSENEEEELRLARNGYNHNVDDFTELYKKLHLRTEFYSKFHALLKEHHEDEKVKAAMMAGNDQGVKDVAVEFLDQYGQSIWKLKGKNSQQDRKLYRETLFDIKKDADRLTPILEELWFHVRDLLYVHELPAAPGPTSLLSTGLWTQYGNRDNPNLRAGPLPAEIPSRAAVPEEWEDGPEQEADERAFLTKVKANRLTKNHLV